MEGEEENDNKGAIPFGFEVSRCRGDCGRIHRSSVHLILPELSPCPPWPRPPRPPEPRPSHPRPPVPVSTNDTAALGGDVIVPGIVFGEAGE